MAIRVVLVLATTGKAKTQNGIAEESITYLIGKERAEGNLESITPLYASCVLHVTIEDVEKCMKVMGYKSHL